MDMQHKLMRHLIVTVFSGLFLLLSLNGCWQINPDFENQMIIHNTTSDTLLFQDTKKYISDIPGNRIDLLPGKIRINVHNRLSAFEMIEEDWKYRGDTIEILRKGFKTVKWGGPLRRMPDSIHSFFNKNSWEIEMGGHNDEYEIATFTFTEEDFKQ